MIPESIRPVLDGYASQIQQALSGSVSGIYILGSIALDAFNERLSDIDFMTVLSHPCTEADLQRLDHIHQQLAAKYPRWKFEGIYIQWADLGRLDDSLSLYPYYADGAFHPSGHRDANSVAWWILKTHGVTLFGPPPDALPFTVDWELLIRQMRDNLNTYWAGYTRNPRRMVWLLTDNGIQWAVLGVLRQYYTFEEHDITSKTGAGQYALLHLPAQWHRIVQEALNIREQHTGSLYGTKLGRANDALKFLKYIIALCGSRLIP